MSEIFQQWQRWQEEFAELGGRNPLASFELSSFSHVDLTRAHPSGLAQLVASRTTRISNLIRDGITQGRSNSAMRRIKDKSDYLLRDFGLNSCFLSAGIARFSGDEKNFPLLLWPVEIGEKSDDYQITISEDPMLNPELMGYLQTIGIVPSKLELLRLARKQGDLLPVRFLDRFSEILAETKAEIDRSLVIGNFTPQLSELRLSKSFEETDLLKRLVAAEGRTNKPELPLLAMPADQNQLQILSSIAAGSDVVVETLPGCGYTQLVVNTLSTLIDKDKRVLVVANRRQTLDELSERLNQANLQGLMLRAHNSWLDIISSISRFEKSEPVDFEATEKKLSESEESLQQYFHLLNQPHQQLGVSLIDCIDQLSNLSSKDSAPTNSARFPEHLLVQLKDSENAKQLLKQANEAGLFSYGVDDTPWFGARFEKQEEIDSALGAVNELLDGDLQMAINQLEEYLSNLNLKKANTVEDWSVQVKLLVGIRETLDKFNPDIYDRPLGDLITATSNRKDRKEMSGAQRRRFKKLAKDYLRPSAQVGNLHNALVEAQKQRELWYELADTKAPPTVPTGLAGVQNVFERVADRITGIQKHLNPDPDFELLSRLEFGSLQKKLADLSQQTEILDGYLQRKEISAQLESAGLTQLSNQLTDIKPDSERLENEFQLSWWQSAFEAVVGENQKILEFDASRIASLEQDYENANQELIDAGSKKINQKQATNWKLALGNSEHAERLKQMLRQRESSLKTIAAQAETVWPAISSVIGCSPLELNSRILDQEKFDVCIVMDAASSGVSEIIPSLTRAEQLVVFGDPAIASAMDFSTIALSTSPDSTTRQSFFDYASDSFGKTEINRSYRPEGQVLGEYLNKEFYGERLQLGLTANQVLEKPNFEFVHIAQDNRATSTIEGATESADGELRGVVQKVISHARSNPEMSLTIASASKVHAERIAKTLASESKTSPELSEFMQSHGREQLVVSSLAELNHRVSDRVIFSLGFALTPEGRVKLNFGDLSGEASGTNLANLIAAARKQMTVISCISSEDLPSNNKSAEIAHLRNLLDHQSTSVGYKQSEDPLLSDLSTRLRKRGVRIIENPSSEISMLAVYKDKVALIDADWQIMNRDWRLYLKGARKLWSQYGFEYRRVHVFELFSEPDNVAKRLADSLGVIGSASETPSQSLFDSNDQDLLENKPPHWG
ncbi:MAG: hypothetical protein RI590_02885 [Microbacteriaceae bacterium]|nr:hypothetical protein [Microbacteriaceae bacterium]